MTDRITVGNEGELTLPRELLEGKPPEEGTVLRAHVDEGGNVILKPVAPVPLREYTGEDLETFARENEMTPEMERRLYSLLEREPRFYGR
jgi:bifunctional DNA-binding transcriptional regulator/antitoxin component of YhaV-PrlF toxin-antitoxin module